MWTSCMSHCLSFYRSRNLGGWEGSSLLGVPCGWLVDFVYAMDNPCLRLTRLAQWPPLAIVQKRSANRQHNTSDQYLVGNHPFWARTTIKYAELKGFGSTTNHIVPYALHQIFNTVIYCTFIWYHLMPQNLVLTTSNTKTVCVYININIYLYIYIYHTT